jgi:hypothetical protein
VIRAPAGYETLPIVAVNIDFLPPLLVPVINTARKVPFSFAVTLKVDFVAFLIDAHFAAALPVVKTFLLTALHEYH